MFAIETELGRFEAETEKEAKKLLRKAKIEAKRKAQEDGKNRDMAYLRAESIGFKILERTWSGKEMYPGWIFHTPDGTNAPFKHHIDFNGISTKPVISWEMPGHNIETKHFSQKFLGAVSNGSGWPMCAFFEEDHKPGEIICYAIGAEKDSIAFVRVPGIKPDLFKSSRGNS